jgi:hypothetical protein
VNFKNLIPSIFVFDSFLCEGGKMSKKGIDHEAAEAKLWRGRRAMRAMTEPSPR